MLVFYSVLVSACMNRIVAHSTFETGHALHCHYCEHCKSLACTLLWPMMSVTISFTAGFAL